jgi:autotransporter-associated beta strand protein
MTATSSLTGGATVAVAVQTAGANTAVNVATVSTGAELEDASTNVGAGTVSETQTVTLTGGTGTFTLAFNGSAATAALAWNASAATVQTALNALTTILGIGGSVTVSSYSPNATTTVYVIAFGAALANLQLPLLTATGTGATATAARLVEGSGKALTLNGSGVINGPITPTVTAILGTGAFRNVSGTNTWQGLVTLNTNPAAISVDAGSLTLDDAINGSGAGQVGGGNGLVKVGVATLQLSGVVADTYTGSTLVNAGVLQLDKTPTVNAIDGGLFIGADTSTPAQVQLMQARQIVTTASVTLENTGTLTTAGPYTSNTVSLTSAVEVVTTNATAGNFTLTFNGQTTASIAFNASTATVQTDLQALSTIGTGNATVTGAAGDWIVTFAGALANAGESQITANNVSLTVAAGTILFLNANTALAGGLAQEIITNLTLTEGPGSSSSVTTVPTNSVLTVSGGVSLIDRDDVTGTSSSAATIAGTL